MRGEDIKFFELGRQPNLILKNKDVDLISVFVNFNTKILIFSKDYEFIFIERFETRTVVIGSIASEINVFQNLDNFLGYTITHSQMTCQAKIKKTENCQCTSGYS